MGDELPEPTSITLDRMLAEMGRRGAVRVFAKLLAPNDNSKNQVYAGPGFDALNILPNSGVEEAPPTAGSVRPRFYARLRFSWLTPSGNLSSAPDAKLILYPKYPEVRISGFLAKSAGAPSALITSREPGRPLLIGVCPDGSLLGFADRAGSPIGRALATNAIGDEAGIFRSFATGADAQTDWRAVLLEELGRISAEGWIQGRRLVEPGFEVACNNRNCGGLTLEAELGIVENSKAEPDFHGWEIKGHSVRDLAGFAGGAITVMTQEPTLGIYATAGFRPFMHRFGYPDRSGIPDRVNFGGQYRVGRRVPLTGLTMYLEGFDTATGVVDLAAGKLVLRDDTGTEALGFPIRQLIDHWSTKHSLAAYVPYVARDFEGVQYRYASNVRLGTGTDGIRFLRAVVDGRVYYDPAPKIEGVTSGHPREKRRSQLRVASADVELLYGAMRTEVVASSP